MPETNAQDLVHVACYFHFCKSLCLDFFVLCWSQTLKIKNYTRDNYFISVFKAIIIDILFLSLSGGNNLPIHWFVQLFKL